MLYDIGYKSSSAKARRKNLENKDEAGVILKLMHKKFTEGLSDTSAFDHIGNQKSISEKMNKRFYKVEKERYNEQNRDLLLFRYR